MARYHVQADLYFSDLKIAKRFMALAEQQLPLAPSITLSPKHTLPSRITLDECYHDEANPRPCTLIDLITTP